MARAADNDPFDVLIIGAGASGAAVAWSLAETRMRIVCFEQGDWMNSSEHPTTKTNWESQQFGPYNIDPSVRGLETGYPINNDESPINVVNFNGVRLRADAQEFKPTDCRFCSNQITSTGYTAQLHDKYPQGFEIYEIPPT